MPGNVAEPCKRGQARRAVSQDICFPCRSFPQFVTPLFLAPHPSVTFWDMPKKRGGGSGVKVLGLSRLESCSEIERKESRHAVVPSIPCLRSSEPISKSKFPVHCRSDGRTDETGICGAAAGCCSRRLAPLKMQMSPQPPRRRHHFSGGYTHFDEHGTAHNFAIVPLRQTNTQQRPRILILTYHGDCPMLIKMRVSGNDGERAPSSEIWIDIIMQKWGT